MAETLEDRTLLTSLISIDDVTAGENETFMFQISLDQAAADDVTVRVNTQTDTASDNDFTFLSNKLVTIPAGELSTQVTVHVHDDEVQELDETFSLVLSDVRLGGETLPADLDIADGTGQGTILNDDGLPGSVFTITGEKIVEGDSDGQLLKFTITRTGGSIGDLNFETIVDFTTLNGTAIAGEDYTAVTETIQFSASEYLTSQSADVFVYVEGDTYQELSETVIGRLSNPTGGSLLKGNVGSLDAVGIIANDDSDYVYQESFSADPVHANHTADSFGSSVAIEGDTMVVGAPYNSHADFEAGIAYIYTRNQQGTPLNQTDDTWDYQTFLQPPIAGERFRFGVSVAIDGDAIVVGAERDGTGAVYVFTRVGDDWKTEAPLVEEIRVFGLPTNAYFGTDVAIYEDTIVVGAHTDVQGKLIHGSAYVFEKQGEHWSDYSMRELVHPVSDYDDYFGDKVAIHGELIVIGATLDNANGDRSGAVYVYEKVGASWITETPRVAKLTASDGQSGDNFGLSVATNGTDIVVAAPNSGINGTLTGSIYIYSRVGTDWSTISPREIRINGSQENYRFGASVGIEDDILLVASLRAEEISGRYGAVYVFQKNADDWDSNATPYSVLTGTANGYSAYGLDAAISNNTIVVSASTLTVEGEDSGGVYVYEIAGDSTWSLTSELSPDEPLTSHQRDEDFGQTIAVSNDYLVIGAPGTDSELAPTGIVYVYRKNDAGTPYFSADDFWEYETSLIDPRPEADLEFGTGVAIDGDTIIVTAETSYNAYGAEVYVYTKNGSDWVTTPPTVTPLLANASRNILKDISVAIQDNTIVVGHVGSSFVDHSGVVFVYEKNGSDWFTIAPTESILTTSDGTEDDDFGISVDIDGDQIVVGASENEGRGAAYLYQKGNTGWGSAAENKLIASDLQLNDDFGRVVAIEGNTVAISSRGSGAGYAGAVYLLDGAQGWSDPNEVRIDPISDGPTYGFGNSIDLDGNQLVVTGSVPPNHLLPGAVYIYERGEDWKNYKETIISYDIFEELYDQRFGHSTAAIHGNQLFVAVLYPGYVNTGSLVYNYNRVSTAEFHLRVVDSPTSTTPVGEVNSLPLHQEHVSEWASYWVEIWVKSNALDGEGVFSTALKFHYDTQFTSATEIEFGTGFTQHQSGEIYDESGIVAGLSAETTAAELGTDDYLLFARIRFESLANDQVNLDLSGKSIGPRQLGFYLSDQEIKLVGDITTVDDPAQSYRANIFANPYDLNDDGAINFSDLLRFATVYQQKPSESSSDYAWFADYNQDDRVSFQDLLLFAANYGKRKSGDTPVTYPQNYPAAWNQLFTVAPAPPPSQSATTIQQSTAESLLDSTVAEVTPQLPPAQQQTLSEIDIQVVDLSDETLGRAAAGTIYIDINAAGYGWFIDATPAEHSEFSPASDLTLIALPDSEAAGLIDLRTVILHELSHLLGYEHDTKGLMQETLAPGVRYLADWESDTDEFFGSLADNTELSPF